MRLKHLLQRKMLMEMVMPVTVMATTSQMIKVISLMTTRMIPDMELMWLGLSVQSEIMVKVLVVLQEEIKLVI